MKRFLTVSLAFTLFLAVTHDLKSRAPATLYMATTGTDSGACTSIMSPCLTYAFAAAKLTPGDTLMIRGGTYAYNFDNGVDGCPGCADGTDLTIDSGAIYVRAYLAETVIVREFHHSRNYWIVKGINIDGVDVFTDGLNFTASHQYFGGFDDAHRIYVTRSLANGCGSSHDGGAYNHLQYFRIYDNGNRDPSAHYPHHGCYWSAPNGIIEDGEFDHNNDANGYGIQLFNNTTLIHPSGIVMRRLSIHDNERGLTTASQGDGNQIYDCLIYANTTAGVDIQTGSSTLFAYNTLAFNGGFALQVISSTGALIKGNIFSGNSNSDIADWSGVNTVYLDNLLANASITDYGNGAIPLVAGVRGNSQNANTFSGTPGFTSTSAPYNFAIASAMSPAVAVGTNLSATFTTDYASNDRPGLPDSWTLGALERVTCTPAKLLVTSQPSNAAVGATLGTVSVGIYSSGDVLCTGATNSVTVAAEGSATWSALAATSGTLTKAAVAGISTWTVLYVSPTTGSGKITATASGLTSVDSNSITISAASHDCPGHHFYFDLDAGDDTFSGCDKDHAWKNGPNMQGTTDGVGPGYWATPHGTGGVCFPTLCDWSDWHFIFKGGVTWPRSEFQWVLGSGSGTSGHPVTYESDPTWFTGASWSRPILDSGGSAAGAQCFLTVTAAPMNYVIFKDFEFTGLYWDASCGGDYVALTGTGTVRLIAPGSWCRDACGSNTFYVKVLKNSGGTNFLNGVTTANFGSGITLNSFTVIDNNSAFANITVTDPAGDGYRDVTVTTGVTTITALNGFRILTTHSSDAIAAGYVNLGSSNTSEMSNLYLHGWAHGAASDGTIDQGACTLYGGGTGSSLHDSVIDGYDSKTVAAMGHGTWGYETSCQGSQNTGPGLVYNTWLGWLANGHIEPDNAGFYQNTCDHIGNSFAATTDPLVVALNAALSISLATKYQDVHDQCFEDTNTADNYAVANNLVNEVEAGLVMWLAPLSGYKAYVYNNVMLNVGNSGNIIVCSTQNFGVTPGGTCDHRQNMIEAAGSHTQITGNSGLDGTVFIGNHFIGPLANSADCTGNCTQNHNTFHLTKMIANTDGYYEGSPSLHPYAPTDSGGDTIGAGASLAAFCTEVLGINSAWPSPCITTTAGVSINRTTKVLTAPNISDSVAVSATPDAGPYKFNASSPMIVSVSPNSAAQGDGPVIVSITTVGATLTEDSFPDIENSGDAVIPGWTPINSSSVSFPLYLAANATVGTRDITVTTGMQVLTLVDGFTVTAATSSAGGIGHPRLRLRIR